MDWRDIMIYIEYWIGLFGGKGIIGMVFFAFHFIFIIWVAINVLMDGRSAESTIAWLLLLQFIPGVAIVLYFLIGINWKKHSLIKQTPEVVFGSHFKEILDNQQIYINMMRDHESESENDIFKTVQLLSRSNNSLVTLSNDYKLYHHGEDFFNALIDDIENATDSIHMEFFIWRSDELGIRIKDVLVKKANQGLKVKLIFDSFGSLARISFKYRRELRDAGIEFKYFLDVWAPVRGFTSINYRNHRKVVVIDGKISYTGGMNVGVEYITGGKNFDYWRDTQIRFVGDVTHLMQSLFIIDWLNSGNEQIDKSTLFPEISFYKKRKAILPIQIALSGPDSSWNAIKMLYINIISNANKEIYIQSPYLILDTSVSEALQVAALGGVKIHIMMTGKPDKKLPFWAAMTYFDDLLDAGVRIYQYQRGFLHTKAIIVDGTLTTIGTTNMDVRSFKLNYEVNTVLYDVNISKEMIEQFQKDLEFCHEIKKEEFKKRKFIIRLRNSLCRILSPLL